MMRSGVSTEQYFIHGINPEPWTAPNMTRAGGVYKSETVRAYQEAISDEFQNSYPNVTPTSDPCSITFCFWRELGGYEVGDGRKANRHIADATNLQKATEDALQGFLYVNDNLVRIVRSVIVSQTADTHPALLILFNRHVDIDPSYQTMIDLLLAKSKVKSTSNIRKPQNVF